jgi:hypothetical protein
MSPGSVACSERYRGLVARTTDGPSAPRLGSAGLAGLPAVTRPVARMERAFLAYDAAAPLNLVAAVRVASPSLVDVLGLALADLQGAHPLLRARIQRRGRTMVFVADVVAPIPVRCIERRDAGQWLGVVEDELATRIPASGAPLARCVHLDGEGNDAEILLTFHHCIADGTSAANLVHELLDRCAAYLSGDAPQSVVRAELPRSLDDRLPATRRGVRAVWPAVTFMLRDMRDEIGFRVGSAGAMRPIASPGRCRIRTVRFDATETGAIVAACRAHRVTVTSALLAALSRQVHTHLDRGRAMPQRGLVWADLRSHLTPSVRPDELGCYVSMMRFVVRVPDAALFEVASEVQQRVGSAARRGDRYTATMLSDRLVALALRWPRARLATVALSYATASGIAETYGPIRVTAVHGFVANSPLGAELAAVAGIFRGELCCDLLYIDSALDETMADAIADGLHAALLEAAA